MAATVLSFLGHMLLVYIFQQVAKQTMESGSSLSLFPLPLVSHAMAKIYKSKVDTNLHTFEPAHHRSESGVQGYFKKGRSLLVNAFAVHEYTSRCCKEKVEKGKLHALGITAIGAASVYYRICLPDLFKQM